MKQFWALFIAVWMSVTLILQLLIGCIDISFMAFPVNVVVMAVLVGLAFVANREWRDAKILIMLASRQMTVFVLAAVVVFCLIMGFVPQNSECNSGYFVTMMGFNRVTSSVLFYSVMLLFMAHLTLVTLRYNRHQNMVWRFRLNHIGLLIAMFGLCFGAADTNRLRAVVPIGETVERAYDVNGRYVALGYSFSLVDFDVEYYETGTPSSFAINGQVDDRPVHITVNNPFRADWQNDIYLTGYDVNAGNKSEYCIIEFIRQPWKYAVMAGLIMMFAGAIFMFWGGRKKELADV